MGITYTTGIGWRGLAVRSLKDNVNTHCNIDSIIAKDEGTHGMELQSALADLTAVDIGLEVLFSVGYQYRKPRQLSMSAPSQSADGETGSRAESGAASRYTPAGTWPVQAPS